ncbi:MAG: phosphohistidine phosphatase [Flavipsychrobacter sp.]|jgi:broad specificity phosphatase PhoE|nr:phosphohistidine phosphatase [Flavipsychrobacter sp.]
MRLSFASILLVLISVALTPLHAQQNKPVTIILLRHAEKELTGKDPALTEKGKQRAQRLKTTLAAWKPDLFYSTATTRTMQTLTPLATQYGKPIQTYSAADQHTFAQLLKQQAGKTIVVVGHSNTIPQLVNVITGKDTYTDLPDDEFGRIFIVTIANGEVSVSVKQY